MKNRQGSYKKVLLHEGALSPWRGHLIKNIDELLKMELDSFHLCTLYILLFLRIRHPKNWLQKRTRFECDNHNPKLLDLIPESFELSEWEKEKLGHISAIDLFTYYNLKGIPGAVNRTMMNWGKGKWKIKLLTYIPSPRELLKLQVENTRCITLTVDHNEIDQLVLASRDPLSFVIHDLDHADHFFNHNESLKGQLGFYRLVDNIYDQPLLKQSLKSDKQFKSEFDYVVSDMNAYVIHLFKCFKSAFERTEENIFPEVIKWWNMPVEAEHAAIKLNTPHFDNQDEFALRSFFENSQEILA